MVLCKCTNLDGREINLNVEKDACGSDLFNSICNYFNIKDRSMYGLIHENGAIDPSYRWWVRMDKVLKKQITGKCQVWAFTLVIKFYPEKHFDKLEEVTRYDEK